MTKKTSTKVREAILTVIKRLGDKATTSQIQADFAIKIRPHLRFLERAGILTSEIVGRPCFRAPKKRGEKDPLPGHIRGLVHSQGNKNKKIKKDDIKVTDVSMVATKLWRVK